MSSRNSKTPGGIKNSI